MIFRRRLIAVSLLSSVLGVLAVPATVEAGPLFDWLFQRNRSQGLAQSGNGTGPYTAGYNPRGVTPGYNAGSNPAYNAGYSAPYNTAYPPAPSNSTVRAQNKKGGFGSCLKGCGLFGSRNGSAYASNRNNPSSAYGAAGQNPTTVGYGGTGGSCGRGWCQQTVVRYVPQIAYRTAYQPVPVTTYKTSTTINPQNGLPRTCTRPCTSYKYEARRVPYTTYRPVYTTVPVADDMGDPAYAQRPSSAAPGGCTSCQNGSSAYGSGPGYTPGNATFLPPSAYGQSGYDARGATPWRPVQPGAGSGYDAASGNRATQWGPADSRADTYSQSAPYGSSTRNPEGATQWSPLGTTAPPASRGDANTRPSLRVDPETEYRGYGYRDEPRYIRPVPMPDDMRSKLDDAKRNRRIDGGGQSEETRNYRAPRSYAQQNGAPAGYDRPYTDQRRPQSEPAARSYADAYASADDESLFSLDPKSPDGSFGGSPALDPPANQTRTVDEAPAFRFDERAVRDLDRVKKPDVNFPLDNDNTARNAPRTRRAPVTRGVRPVHEDEAVKTQSQSRYAAVPIDWSQQRAPRPAPRQPASSSNRTIGWRAVH